MLDKHAEKIIALILLSDSSYQSPAFACDLLTATLVYSPAAGGNRADEHLSNE